MLWKWSLQAFILKNAFTSSIPGELFSNFLPNVIKWCFVKYTSSL